MLFIFTGSLYQSVFVVCYVIFLVRIRCGDFSLNTLELSVYLPLFRAMHANLEFLS